MSVETLGEAWSLSWQIYVRCLYDGREGMKHRRACGYRKYLDLETLVLDARAGLSHCPDSRAPAVPAVRLSGRIRDVQAVSNSAAQRQCRPPRT